MVVLSGSDAICSRDFMYHEQEYSELHVRLLKAKSIDVGMERVRN
jgi:hypothetical protein